MSETLVVVLEDVVAGTLTRSAAGRLAFSYDEDYRRRPETTPLSLSLPKQVREHTGARLEAWLWGLLPDNDAVLRRWGRDFHVSASSPFALLSTPVGEDCAGAVRFLAPDRIEQLLDRPGGIAWLTEEEVAERLRDLRADTTAWLGRAFTGQFSLAGARRSGVPSRACRRLVSGAMPPAVTAARGQPMSGCARTLGGLTRHA